MPRQILAALAILGLWSVAIWAGLEGHWWLVGVLLGAGALAGLGAIGFAVWMRSAVRRAAPQPTPTVRVKPKGRRTQTKKRRR